jgi:hypothetical protein
MYLSKENKQILKKFTDGKTIKDKYYGIQAMNKIKQLFFLDKKNADKWANRWTDNEKKRAVYVTYFVKNNTHTKFIIGEGKRLSVLGHKNMNKIKTLKKNMNRKKNKTKKQKKI